MQVLMFAALGLCSPRRLKEPLLLVCTLYLEMAYFPGVMLTGEILCPAVAWGVIFWG